MPYNASEQKARKRERPARTTSEDAPPIRQRHLHVPHRSRHVARKQWVEVDRPIPETWKRMAHAKGFRIHSRVRDRFHVALECKSCGALTAHKSFTLRTAQPRCGACAETAMIEKARSAGLIFLRRDLLDRHYALYRGKCGHILRRQFEFVERVVAGKTDVHCDTCMIEREQQEAARQGWRWLDRDPQRNPDYRLYRHHCGHRQRIARVNMAWGQVKCAACGDAWNATASQIYLLRIHIPGRLDVLKFGFSKNPLKRFRHQLGLPQAAEVELIRTIAMCNGHEACSAERQAHAFLRRHMPAAVVPAERYAGLLNTKTEVYTLAAHAAIMREMDTIEARHPSAPPLQPPAP